MSIKQRPQLLLIAVFASFVMQGGTSILSPGIQTVANHFTAQGIPLDTVMLISSLPAFMCMVAAVIGGALAGKRVDYKTLLLVALAIITVCGTGPLFAGENFTLILVFRFLIGIGIGLVYSVAPALVVRLYENPQRGTFMGFGQFFATGGGMVMQLSVGFIAAIALVGYKYIYAVYGLAFVCFILVLIFLKEPERFLAVPVEEKTSILKLPFRVYFNFILCALFMVLSFPVILSVSTIVETRQLGDPSIAGMALTLFNVGGLGMTVVFGVLNRLLKKWTIVFVFACTILSQILVVTAQNVVVLFVGMLLFSSGLLVLITSVMDSSSVLPPEKASFASGLMAAGCNLGVFLSSFFVSAVFAIFNTDDPTIVVWVAMACLIAVTVIVIITRIVDKKSPVESLSK